MVVDTSHVHTFVFKSTSQSQVRFCINKGTSKSKELGLVTFSIYLEYMLSILLKSIKSVNNEVYK